MKRIVVLYLAALFFVGYLSAAPLKQQQADPSFNFEAADEYFLVVE